MFEHRDFKKLVEEKNYIDALDIIASLCHNKPSDIVYLSDYINIAEKLIGSLKIQDYKKMLEDIEVCLDRYKAQRKLNQSKLDQLKILKNKFDDIKEAYKNEDLKTIEKEKQQINLKNQDILDGLKEKLLALDDVNNEKEFSIVLNSVRKLEKDLDVLSLSDDERILYDNLIDNYANKIQQLTDKFNQIALKEYNLMAIDNLHEVYEEFIKNKRKFIKHFSEYKTFLVDKLLSLDVNKLYKESNEYYNYVYSYIFNRLDNDDKYVISKLVLEVTKK